MFLSLDGTFFVQLINFAIFFAILNFVFLRPVSRAVMERRRYIESVTEDYDRYQAEANELKAEAQAVRALARREAEQLVSAARAQASNETAELSASYAERTSAIIQQADRAVQEELDRARAGSDAASRELASVILKRAVPELAT